MKGAIRESVEERRKNHGRRKEDLAFAMYLAMSENLKGEVYQCFLDCGDFVEAIDHVAETFGVVRHDTE